MTEITPWKVLVVDDDEGIHSITRMIFRGYEFENRPIQLLNALSGHQAREILRAEKDIAVAILDVVMETDHEGLALVDFIRKEQQNKNIRIILRTGHPGFAPETEVVIHYDINDYLSKAELSASRLLTSVIVALRSFRDIQASTAPTPLKQHKTAKGCQPSDEIEHIRQQFTQTLQPVIDDIQKLNLFNHKPIIKNLTQQIQTNVNKLASFGHQLAEQVNFEEAPEETATLEQLLDELSQSLVASSHEQAWIFDYETCQQTPLNSTIKPPYLRHILTTAIDLTLRLRSSGNIILDILCSDDLITFNFKLQDKVKEPSTYWSERLTNNLQKHIDAVGANIIFDQSDVIISLKFRLDTLFT